MSWQKNILDDDPKLSGLYPVGTVVKVKQILKAQDENIRVLVTGLYRAKITDMTQSEPFLSGYVERIPEPKVADSIRCRALRREANAVFGAYLDLSERPAQPVQIRIMASNDCGFIADSIAQNTSIDYPDKAKLLCQIHPVKRLEKALMLLNQEVEMLQIEAEIQHKTRSQIDQNQRDYYLREQMKAIREELGEADEFNEFLAYEKGIIDLKLSKETEEKLLKDVTRLKKQPFGSAEASVLRNYLDTVLELPWNTYTQQ